MFPQFPNDFLPFPMLCPHIFLSVFLYCFPSVFPSFPILDFVQISTEWETQESKAGYTKNLNLHSPKTYMCKYRVNQHLIILNLGNFSINKVLVTEFITVKLSQNLNLMWNMSTQWNQQFSKHVFSKVIECFEQNIRKQIDCKRRLSTKKMNRRDYKIFILKYTNRDI